jgi:16S rRNA (guanine966-N2)-methyltransferase
VREALFMTLEPLQGLEVVDLYAGSGALGIEALSRGAAHVDFVEASAAARKVLEANLAELDLDGRSRIWRYPLPQGVRRLEAVIAAADLILIDPPYGGAAARATLAALAEGKLKAGVRIVVEHHAKDELPERSGGLARTRQRRYGETVVSHYQAVPTGPRAEER